MFDRNAMDPRESTNASRSRAGRLRRRKRPLNAADRAWLNAYDRAHQTTTRTIAEIEEAARENVSRETPGELEAELGALELGDPRAAELVEELDDDDAPEKPAAERALDVQADMLGHGAGLLVRAVEMHERVSERALALLEQVADLQARQSAQLVDAFTALAEARASSMAAEADDDDDRDGDRTDRLEALLAQVAGPHLAKLTKSAISPPTPGRPPARPPAA